MSVVTTDAYREHQDRVTVTDGDGVRPQLPIADMASARTLLAATGVGAGRASPDTQRMEIRFYVDPDTSLPHIHSHDVREDEVKDVLRRSGEDRPGTEGSRVALGQTRAGRYLRVIYVPDPEPDSVFVITAYELTGKALTAYRRRSRRKRQ